MPGKELGSYIDRTYKVVRQDLINRFKESNVNLTPEQWVILSKLDEVEMYQTNLANLSFKDKPTVSRIIDLLVKKNLVKRRQDKADGRKFWVAITEQGRQVVKQAYPSVEASRELGWTNLSEDEYTTLIDLLDKIFANYTEEGKSPCF